MHMCCMLVIEKKLMAKIYQAEMQLFENVPVYQIRVNKGNNSHCECYHVFGNSEICNTKFCFLFYSLSWGHSYSTYASFSVKLTFLTPWYAHVRTCAYQGVRNVIFSETFVYLLNNWLPSESSVLILWPESSLSELP